MAEQQYEPTYRVMFWLTDYCDEVVPCDCSLDGWAKWLSQPDELWGRGEPETDGASFGATRGVVTYHHAIVDGSKSGWRFHPPLPQKELTFALSYGVGQGWSADEMAGDLTDCYQLLRECGGDGSIVAAIDDDPAPYVVTYNSSPPRCTATKAN